MYLFIKRGLILLAVLLFVIATGCVSSPDQKGNSTVPLPVKEPVAGETIIGYSPDHANWIRINPIPNYYQGAGLVETSIALNISGTTTFPAGSIVWIDSSLDTPRFMGRSYNWAIKDRVATIQKNLGSENSFAYSINIADYPPVERLPLGRYRVTVRKVNTNITAEAFFHVLLNRSARQILIDIDPIPVHNVGDNFPVTGTTNLPVGSLLSINIVNSIHSCPTRTPGSPESGVFLGSICGGKCKSLFINDTVSVLPGDGGTNRWSMPLNTTGWCSREIYEVRGSFRNWNNVTSDIRGFEFHYPVTTTNP
jgi:hypothetical protein